MPWSIKGDAMAVANIPIATAEQCKHERFALELYRDPSLVRVRDAVRSFWLDEVKPGDEMRACFEWAFEEVIFGAVIWALNQDPLSPAVITIARLPQPLGGLPRPYCHICVHGAPDASSTTPHRLA